MNHRSPAFFAAAFGILLIIFLAGCENPIMVKLLKPWDKKDTPEIFLDGPTYTVTFDSKGGSAVSSQIVGEGLTASRPADPT
jgi:hypothetical protein